MIQFLNKYGDNIGYRDFIEVQWTRRWSGSGEFSIYLAKKDYDESAKYVTNAGRPETGIIQKVEFEENENGEFITLAGFFIEKVADFGAIQFNESYKTDNYVSSKDVLETLINRGLTDPKNKPNAVWFVPYNTYTFETDPASVFPTSLVGNIEKATPIGQALFYMLSGTDYSYSCSAIFAQKELEIIYPLLGLKFLFKKGRDLTDKVFFGEEYNNVIKLNYRFDDSAAKPFYLLFQEIPSLSGWSKFENIQSYLEAGEWKYLGQTHFRYNENSVSDLGECYPHKVLQTQIDNVEIIQANEAKVIEQMKQQAQLDMLSNYKIEEIEALVLQERFKYLLEYDLGDKCTVVINDIKQMYSVRIEEVREVHHDNKIDIELVLGTPQKQKWRQII